MGVEGEGWGRCRGKEEGGVWKDGAMLQDSKLSSHPNTSSKVTTSIVAKGGRRQVGSME